jgi:hypothetical protein
LLARGLEVTSCCLHLAQTVPLDAAVYLLRAMMRPRWPRSWVRNFALYEAR